MNPQDYIADLVAHEGCIPWLYCDSLGFVTIGIGNLVAKFSDTIALPLAHADGTPATDEEKTKAWYKVFGTFNRHATTHLPAAGYKGLTDLRITQDYAETLAEARLVKEFLPGLMKVFNSFAGFPMNARRGLVDMIYNLGVGRFTNEFPKFIAAVRDGRWTDAAAECHRSSCRDERNDWTKSLFASCGEQS